MTTAAPLPDRDFWLPTLAGGLLRTEEFPYKIGMLRSEVSSPVSNGSEEEDDFFASFAQRLTLSQSRNVNLYTTPTSFKESGGSPQSALEGVGSWSVTSSNGSNSNSPPTTPFETQEDTLGLIYAAAGQVEKLQRNAEEWRAVAKPNLNQQQFASLQSHKADFYAVEQMKLKYIAAVRLANQAAMFLDQRLQDLKRSEMLNQSAWPSLQQARVPMKPNYRAIPLQRNESAGTGVFIPRRFDADMIVPPRKKAVVPCALVPDKVVQALNTSIESLGTCPLPHYSPVSSADSVTQQSFDALMARRRALLDQQHSSMVKTEDMASRSLEACLPQEWSY